MSKLRGGKLEAEVDRCRGECNWQRLAELLPSIKARNSGLEKKTSLIEGELALELFIERRTERVQPRPDHYSFLRTAEGFLNLAIASNRGNAVVVMEANLLLAKLHYFSAKFEQSLSYVENSKLDQSTTQFETLRSLKLAAEGYAIRGFALQHQLHNQPDNPHDLKYKRMLSSFDSAVELGLSYVTLYEKQTNTQPRAATAGSLMSVHSSSSPRADLFHMGDLLVEAMECAPMFLSKRGGGGGGEQRTDLLAGIELYRHIMTELSDKSAVEQIQQRLCRQLAEVLLRGSFDSSYSLAEGSRAISNKSSDLNFYTGSSKNYYAPVSRIEEIILVLLISELIASRAMRHSRIEGDSWQHTRTTENLKQVHNLLAVVLARLRQHAFLASLMDRAIQFAGSDRSLWRQFGLALACTGRTPRAITVLKHGASLEGHAVAQAPAIAPPGPNSKSPHGSPEKRKIANGRSTPDPHNGAKNGGPRLADGGVDDRIVEHMMIARLMVEQPTDDPDAAMEHAQQALSLCHFNELSGRCMLLYALAFSIKARSSVSWDLRRAALNKSIENFERAIEFDSKDDLTHFFCALEYAEVRNLAAARDCCARALERNPFNVSAVMLMALLFTAKHDYKNALKLVHENAANFPGHYGLLVLRLRLESRFGRLDRALRTSRHLLSFWRRSATAEPFFEDDLNQATVHSMGAEPTAAENGVGTAASAVRAGSIAHLTSKDALGPVTPIFTAPLGITAAALPQHATVGSSSAIDLTEVASSLGPSATRISEHGAGAGTSSISDSLGIGTTSSLTWAGGNSFRLRANIWVEVAELFLESESVNELIVCVDEAFALFPGSYQVMYLKGRIALLRAESQAILPDGAANPPSGVFGTTGDAQKRSYAEARAHFLAALAANPTHVASFRYLAAVYRAEQNVKMAEKMLKEATAVDPLNEDIWQELGRVLAEQNCFDEANDCFQAAAAVHGTLPLMPFDVIPRVLKSCF
ncbi:Tetratricopeptide repeat protein 7B [Aphelenchoides fujianensis]|nr:Tetratricopeptide repeat protein 7B [Aphelenchoides fujianensis]KAI6233768.1 Tetratricopeptide repeat protein 7B [Aphelenchoides fujianensis]